MYELSGNMRNNFPSFPDGISLRFLENRPTPTRVGLFLRFLAETFIEVRSTPARCCSVWVFPFLFGGAFIEATESKASQPRRG